jgi:hypothetical protein
LEEKKVEWARRTCLIHLRKLDWIYIDEPLAKEFIYNFQHVDQYIKLNDKHFNLGKGVVQVFEFPWERIVGRRRKGYNLTITNYFTRTKHEHDVPHFGYLITKALGRKKLIQLEALIEILAF